MNNFRVTLKFKTLKRNIYVELYIKYLNIPNKLAVTYPGRQNKVRGKRYTCSRTNTRPRTNSNQGVPEPGTNIVRGRGRRGRVETSHQQADVLPLGHSRVPEQRAEVIYGEKWENGPQLNRHTDSSFKGVQPVRCRH